MASNPREIHRMVPGTVEEKEGLEDINHQVPDLILCQAKRKSKQAGANSIGGNACYPSLFCLCACVRGQLGWARVTCTKLVGLGASHGHSQDRLRETTETDVY